MSTVTPLGESSPQFSISGFVVKSCLLLDFSKLRDTLNSEFLFCFVLFCFSSYDFRMMSTQNTDNSGKSTLNDNDQSVRYIVVTH